MHDLFEDFERTAATLSDCRRYRYSLMRRWGRGDYALFIGLNPSTADETEDDPTIRRCMGFAKRFGCDALMMANLFAFRATDPAVMKAEADPVGPLNDAALAELAAGAQVIIAAWGVHGTHDDRDAEVINRLSPRHKIWCLGLTQDGHPRHPLYMASDADLLPYRCW